MKTKLDIRSTLASLLQQDCVLCGAPSGDAALCAPCAAGLPQLAESCPRCALPSPAAQLCGQCIAQPPHFDRTIAAFRYEFPLDRLIQALKYHGRLALAPWFAASLIAHLDRAAVPELLVPMPLARPRLRERGFNQALEIARPLARALGMALDVHAARRTRATQPQAQLPLQARAGNVRGAFSCGFAAAGKRVAVLDDVMTSGTTLNELAHTLKRAGAVHVENWVVARAYRHV